MRISIPKIILAGSSYFTIVFLSALISDTKVLLLISKSLRLHRILLEPFNKLVPYITSKLNVIKPQESLSVVSSDFGLRINRNYLQLGGISLINVHSSFLPHWKGSAPIQRFIQLNSFQYGYTAHRTSARIDGGNVMLSRVLRNYYQNAIQLMFFNLATNTTRDILFLLRNTKCKTQMTRSSRIPVPTRNKREHYARKLVQSKVIINPRAKVSSGVISENKIRSHSVFITSGHRLISQSQVINCTNFSRTIVHTSNNSEEISQLFVYEQGQLFY